MAARPGDHLMRQNRGARRSEVLRQRGSTISWWTPLSGHLCHGRRCAALTTQERTLVWAYVATNIDTNAAPVANGYFSLTH